MNTKHFIALFWIASISWAQFLPGTDWRSIAQDQVEIIYPQAQEAEAIRTLGMVLGYQQQYVQDLPGRKKPISIIFDDQDPNPNGFVTLSPFRAHFYMAPTLLGQQEWLTALSIHENRHVQQFRAIASHNFLGVGTYILFGDQGLQLASAFIPEWFYEGDAVWAETHYSHGGRGRSWTFLDHFRPLADSNVDYSLMDLRMGAYGIPPQISHYDYGYLMVQEMRDRAQASRRDPWAEIISNGVNPIKFNTWSGAVASEMNHRWFKQSNTWGDWLQALWYGGSSMLWDSTWIQFKNKTHPLIPTQISPVQDQSQKGPDPYYSHQAYSDGQNLYIEQNNYNQVRTLYRHQNGLEFCQSIGQNAYQISLAPGKIAWLYHQPHWRFSEDVGTNIIEIGQLCHGMNQAFAGNWLGATLDRLDSNTLWAVEILPGRSQQILKIHLPDFKITDRLSFPATDIVDGSQLDGENGLIYVRFHQGLSEIHFWHGSLDSLIYRSQQLEEIDHPFIHQGRVWFSTHRSGTSQIYSMDEHGILQQSSRPTGAFNPIFFHDSLWFSDQGLHGTRIVSAPVLDQIPQDSIQRIAIPFAESSPQALPVQSQSREVSVWNHALDAYSWNYTGAIALISSDSALVNSGLYLMGGDPLDNFSYTLGGLFGKYLDRIYPAAELDLTWAGFWLPISINNRVGQFASVITDSIDHVPNDFIKVDHLKGIHALDLSLPYLHVGASQSFQLLADGSLQYNWKMDSILYQNYVATATAQAYYYRDGPIGSSGYQLGLSWSEAHVIDNTADPTYEKIGSGILILPGLWWSHSLGIRSTYFQTNDPSLTANLFSSPLLLNTSKSWNNANPWLSNLWVLHQAEYVFPIWRIYGPDVGLGRLLYFQELLGGPFANCGWGRNLEKTGDPWDRWYAVGLHTELDFNVFSFANVPLSLTTDIGQIYYRDQQSHGISSNINTPLNSFSLALNFKIKPPLDEPKAKTYNASRALFDGILPIDHLKP